MATIQIQLPSDRTQLGTLTLLDGNNNPITGTLNAYGKASDATAKDHGNLTSDPKQLYGDTPLGGYSFNSIVQTGDNDGTGKHPKHKYGNNGAILMIPTSGDAATAATNGHRTGLMIHGGDLDTQGKLRRTNGCVRLSDGDMQTLINAINILSPGDPLMAINIIQTNLRRDAQRPLDSGSSSDQDDDGSDYDEGDPPPGAPPISLVEKNY